MSQRFRDNIKKELSKIMMITLLGTMSFGSILPVQAATSTQTVANNDVQKGITISETQVSVNSIKASGNGKYQIQFVLENSKGIPKGTTHVMLSAAIKFKIGDKAYTMQKELKDNTVTLEDLLVPVKEINDKKIVVDMPAQCTVHENKKVKKANPDISSLNGKKVILMASSVYYMKGEDALKEEKAKDIGQMVYIIANVK